MDVTLGTALGPEIEDNRKTIKFLKETQLHN